jgi:hypothetical protein
MSPHLTSDIAMWVLGVMLYNGFGTFRIAIANEYPLTCLMHSCLGLSESQLVFHALLATICASLTH